MANEPQMTEMHEDAASRKRGGANLRIISICMVILATIIALLFLFSVKETNGAYRALETASENYVLGESAAGDMKAGSNYLTIQVRSFVVTQNPEYMKNYFWEANENQRRQNAVETFKSLQGGSTGHLDAALSYSMELMEMEYYAMRLVTEAKGYTELQDAYLADVELTTEDAALSADAKVAKAQSLMFSEEYTDYVDKIEEGVATCKADLMETIDKTKVAGQEKLDGLLLRQQILAALMIIVGAAMMAAVFALVLRPLQVFSGRIKDNRKLPDMGASELREMAGAYNEMYSENMRNHDILRQKAEHDPLTGLYNRGVFEQLLELHADEQYAIIIVDVDNFKDVNDSLGHDVGDAALQKVAGLLNGAFRTTDYPCRLGGDEFVVFMTEMTEDLRYVVETKIKGVMDGLQDTSDGLPAFTVSVGVAFNDGTLTGDQAFKHADQALYKVKEAGRNGLGFYAE